jgi:hypothetical protein
MPDSNPRTGPRHEPERVYERAADAAEAANRPLEPKSSDGDLAARDEPAPNAAVPGPDPHHALSNPVGEPDPTADSDPYEPTSGDQESESDRASGTRGANQGAEDR